MSPKFDEWDGGVQFKRTLRQMTRRARQGRLRIYFDNFFEYCEAKRRGLRRRQRLVNVMKYLRWVRMLKKWRTHTDTVLRVLPVLTKAWKNLMFLDKIWGYERLQRYRIEVKLQAAYTEKSRRALASLCRPGIEKWREECRFQMRIMTIMRGMVAKDRWRVLYQERFTAWREEASRSKRASLASRKGYRHYHDGWTKVRAVLPCVGAEPPCVGG